MQSVLNIIKLFGLTNDQIGGWVRASLGPLVTAAMLWLAQKGWLPVDQANVIAPLITGAIVAFLMGVWSSFTNSQSAKKASVAAIPNTLVVETKPQEGTTAPVADIAQAIAASPNVKQVITTPVIAAAAPSDKVVSHETASIK